MQGSASLRRDVLKKLHNRTVRNAAAGHSETPGSWCTLPVAVEASVKVLIVGQTDHCAVLPEVLVADSH